VIEKPELRALVGPGERYTAASSNVNGLDALVRTLNTAVPHTPTKMASLGNLDLRYIDGSAREVQIVPGGDRVNHCSPEAAAPKARPYGQL